MAPAARRRLNSCVQLNTLTSPALAYCRQKMVLTKGSTLPVNLDSSMQSPKEGVRWVKRSPTKVN